MKVLSVRQPWAWALIHGGKDVENRNWMTSYRGRLAIHAGKAFDMTKAEWHNMSMGDYGEPFAGMAKGYNQQDSHVLGAIVGLVDLVDCIPDHRCTSPWKADGYDFWCWVVKNPRPLMEPIPIAGRLGLWDVPDSLFGLEELKGKEVEK